MAEQYALDTVEARRARLVPCVCFGGSCCAVAAGAVLLASGRRRRAALSSSVRFCCARAPACPAERLVYTPATHLLAPRSGSSLLLLAALPSPRQEHIKEGWEVDSTETQSAKSEGVPRFLGT